MPITEGGWVPVAPTAEPFADGYPVPRALATHEIAGIVAAFRDAARRALAAGFDIAEIHAAHGYLIHEFLSPLVNTRADQHGGTFDGRIRLCVEVLDAVRSVWPDDRPVFVCISSTDWVPGGWTIDDSVALARRLAAHGADFDRLLEGATSRRPTFLLAPVTRSRLRTPRREAGLRRAPSA